MRLHSRLAAIGIVLILVPLILVASLVLVRANARIADLVEQSAQLELAVFASRAQAEHETIVRLGVATSDFYVRTAKTAVLQYGAERMIHGGFLYVLDDAGRQVLMGGTVRPNDLVISRTFEPWNWTLGVAIAYEYVNGFVSETTRTVVYLSAIVSLAAVLIFWVVTRRAVQPIVLLEASANAIAQGELSTRAPEQGALEVASLARTFNRMAAIVENLTRDLENQVATRTRELQESIDELRASQELLVQRERMASLGRLVAGVAHEINTPIGIGVTSATFLRDRADAVAARLSELKDAGKEVFPIADLETFVTSASEASTIVHRSLQRAETLISTFKNLAVDQTSGAARTFDLGDYLRDIAKSLAPQIKRSNARLNVVCEDEIVVTSYPGHFYQILMNLSINSLTHAFPEGRPGRITISAERTPDGVRITHTDDGVGMTEEQVQRIYEPFYTTRLGEGGSGLGMNIVYNTVNQSLGGTISVTSAPDEGATFTIVVPNSHLSVDSRESRTSYGQEAER